MHPGRKWASVLMVITAATLLLVLGAETAAFAQGQNYDYSYPPPYARHENYGPGWGRARCSLEQREYAYINECGELIPGTWDRILGRG